MARNSKWDSIPKLRYDTDAILARVSFREAFERYTGQTYITTKNVKCIDAENHKNGDKNPSMRCYPNNCFCYNCNVTYDTFGLVARSRGLDRNDKHDFPKILEAICEDFNIDRASVSNLAEVEAAKAAAFGQSESYKPTFYDFFPLNSTELETIGLFDSNGYQELFYPVDAQAYYCHFNNCEFDELPARLQKRCFDEDGKPVMIQATHREAVDMGIIPESYCQGVMKDGRDCIPAHHIRDLWNDDKEGTEALIISKAYETAERINIMLNKLQASVENYAQTHDVAREARFAQGYIDMIGNGRRPALTTEQRNRMNEYFDFMNDNTKIEVYREMSECIEMACDKIANQQARRAAFRDSHDEEDGSDVTPPSDNNLPQ